MMILYIYTQVIFCQHVKYIRGCPCDQQAPEAGGNTSSGVLDLPVSPDTICSIDHQASFITEISEHL